MSDLLNKIKQDESEKMASQKPWTLEEIQKVWDYYGEITDSPSTKNTLEVAKLSLKSETIIGVLVPNKLSMETIKTELKLVETLREAFLGKDFSFDFEVDIDAFPEFERQEEKTYLSDQQKLDLLIAKNPTITELIKRFDLKLDK